MGDSNAITPLPQVSPPASSFLQSSMHRAHRALSFEQANARCHTQEGYWKGKQPGRRDFYFICFSVLLYFHFFQPHLWINGLVGDQQVYECWLLQKNKTEVFHELSKGEKKKSLTLVTGPTAEVWALCLKISILQHDSVLIKACLISLEDGRLPFEGEYYLKLCFQTLEICWWKLL